MTTCYMVCYKNLDINSYFKEYVTLWISPYVTSIDPWCAYAIGSSWNLNPWFYFENVSNLVSFTIPYVEWSVMRLSQSNRSMLIFETCYGGLFKPIIKYQISPWCNLCNRTFETLYIKIYLWQMWKPVSFITNGVKWARDAISAIGRLKPYVFKTYL